MYESFFNYARVTQRDADSSNNVGGCLRKRPLINFSYFQFRSRSRDCWRERWKMCVIERDGRRDCGAAAWIMREYDEHVYTIRMCTYRVTPPSQPSV